MAPINRAPWNALVDDDGSNLVGTPWTKDIVKTVLLDPIDVSLASLEAGKEPTITLLPVAKGGTGIASYAVGDLLYASATTTLARRAAVAVGQVLVSGGVAAPPVWSATPTVTNITTSGVYGTGVLALGGVVANQLMVNGAGGLLPFSSDNAQQIGSPANRFSTGYFGTSVVAPLITLSGTSSISGAGGDVIFTAANRVIPANSNTIALGWPGNLFSTGYFGTALVIGATPASIGAIRLTNSNSNIYGRNAANTGDLFMMGVDASNNLVLGSPIVATALSLTSVTATSYVQTPTIITPDIRTQSLTHLSLGTNNAVRWFVEGVGNTGHFYPNVNNAEDLGGISNRVRNGYFGTSVIAPLITSPAASDLSIAAPAGQSILVGFTGGNSVLNIGGLGLYPAVDDARALGISALRWQTGSFGTGGVAIGTNPATVGEIRLPNNSNIYFRNNANTGDARAFQFGSDNQVYVHTNFRPGTDATYNLGDPVIRWVGGYFSNVVAIGTNPASAGAVRLANGATISARNAGNTADLNIVSVNASNDIIFGTGGASSGATLSNNNFTLASGGTLITTNVALSPATGGFQWVNQSVMRSPSDGVILLTNALITGFGRLQFGGTTSAFPALKRNGAALDVRVADDSAYTFVTAATYVVAAGGAFIGSGLPAQSGTLRVQNNDGLFARNAANTSDLFVVKVAGDDVVEIAGASGAGVRISAGTGDIRWGRALVALGGGATPTLGTIAGSGPASAAQNSWMRVQDSTGAVFFVPAWK